MNPSATPQPAWNDWANHRIWTDPDAEGWMWRVNDPSKLPNSAETQIQQAKDRAKEIIESRKK